MWSQSQLSDTQTQRNFKNPIQSVQGPLLQQNDFLKIINLQQRYNYYKSLTKLQRLNNLNEQTNQSTLIKIMHQLIQYYAQCISQAEMHKENIIMYFQQKMKDINYHYKAIQDKQKNEKIKQTEIEMKEKITELGYIQQSVSIFGIQQELQSKNPELQAANMKSNHNKTLMAAIQNQNIQEHINNTMKKVDFLKKSIASIIQNQEQKLQNRIKDKRKKASINRMKPSTPQSITTEATLNQKHEVPFKKKKQTYSSFHTNYHARLSSSESELDEAESMYISTFNIEQEQKYSQNA